MAGEVDNEKCHPRQGPPDQLPLSAANNCRRKSPANRLEQMLGEHQTERPQSDPEINALQTLPWALSQWQTPPQIQNG